MRSKRGITLVSLVVTIIVLIILAGVSINLTLGENGIITMAKKARENMELAQIEEQTNLNDLYEQILAEGGVSGNLSNGETSQLAEFKKKIASALTDIGIETLETANADTMASNIRNISISKDAVSISYDNTNSGLTSTNMQGAVDEIDGEMDELNNSIENSFGVGELYETLDNSITSYTATRNGWLQVFGKQTNDNAGYIFIYRGNAGDYNAQFNTYFSPRSSMPCLVPIRKGQTWNILTHGGVSVIDIKFFYD